MFVLVYAHTMLSVGPHSALPERLEGGRATGLLRLDTSLHPASGCGLASHSGSARSGLRATRIREGRLGRMLSVLLLEDR